MLSIALLAGSSSISAPPKTFTPTSVAYADLLSNQATPALRAALTEVGMISVTGIPGYAELRKSVLAKSHLCTTASGAAQSHHFPDGTTRRTLATYTIPGPGGAQPVKHESSAAECAAFEGAATPFRALVADATTLFGKRLSALVALPKPSPALLATAEGHSFPTLLDVVSEGEHLEHFHSYTKPASATAGKGAPDTIDTHTDHGIFIAFTPALSLSGRAATADAEDAAAFYVELADGSRPRVAFEADSLVFMLGDGLHQILPKNARSPLRATPHSLVMSPTSSARAWYGRMVLPPKDAVSPQHGHTFGQQRAMMIDDSLANDAASGSSLSVGCSHHDLHANQRELSTCAAGTVYCWHRCMNISQSVVGGEATCAAEGLSAMCVNSRNQLYTSNGHGDYYPACANASSIADETSLNEDPHTKLPLHPRNATTCTDAAFATFAHDHSYGHAWTIDRPPAPAWGRRLSSDHAGHGDSGGSGGSGGMGGGEPWVFKMSWTLLHGAGMHGKVQIKLDFNGLFGWVSVGFRNHLDAIHNGMNGANIVLSAPGAWTDQYNGFDLSAGATTNEYLISPYSSEFRTWGTPIAQQGLSNVTVDATDCFTSVTFIASGLNGQAFNLSGTDTLIWGANGEDRFAGYHGRTNRGIFDVTWQSGAAEFTAYPPPPNPHPPPPSPAAPPSPPPRPPTTAAVTVGMRVSGTVEQYSNATVKAALESAMAAVAMVQPSAVSVVVTAGSALLTFAIETTDAAADALAATVAAAVATPAAATAVFSAVPGLPITVEAVTSAPVAASLSPSSGVSAGVIAGAVVGGVALLLLLVVLAYYLMKKKAAVKVVAKPA